MLTWIKIYHCPIEQRCIYSIKNINRKPFTQSQITLTSWKLKLFTCFRARLSMTIDKNPCQANLFKGFSENSRTYDCKHVHLKILSRVPTSADGQFPLCTLYTCISLLFFIILVIYMNRYRSSSAFPFSSFIDRVLLFHLFKHSTTKYIVHALWRLRNLNW